MSTEAFNLIASDKISMHRSVPDTRDPKCQAVSYETDLPTSSIIIIFTNEAWSPLIRTIWSVLDNTPADYLQEIILVDDFSDKTHLKVCSYRVEEKYASATVHYKTITFWETPFMNSNFGSYQK